MNLGDMISKARRWLDDTADPPLWTDEALIDSANRSVNEAARRGRLLIDTRTAEICHYDVVAGDPFIRLDPRILFVRRARLTVIDAPLIKGDVRDLDNGWSWEDATGMPTHYLTDMESGSIRLYPIPDSDDHLRLTVVRLPLTPLSGQLDEPEINPRYHDSLVYWMVYDALMTADTEMRDDQKAAGHLALFEAEFGRPSPAVNENWINLRNGFDPNEGLF